MIKKLNIYELLDYLQKRKAMFLGHDYTFQSLEAFLGGFLLGTNAQSIKDNVYNDFSYFNIWLLGYLSKTNTKQKGWYNQITNYTNGDDAKAFDIFFNCLDKFKTAKKYTEIIDIAPLNVISNKPNLNQTSIPKQNTINTILKIKMEYSNSILVKGYNGDDLIYETWFLSEFDFNQFIKR